MQLSDGKHEFEENFDRLFGKQRYLPLGQPVKLLDEGKA